MKPKKHNIRTNNPLDTEAVEPLKRTRSSGVLDNDRLSDPASPMEEPLEKRVRLDGDDGSPKSCDIDSSDPFSDAAKRVDDITTRHDIDFSEPLSDAAKRVDDIPARQAGATFASVLKPDQLSETAISSTESSIPSDVVVDAEGSGANKDFVLGPSTVYLEDLETLVVRELPDRCEVADEDSQDILLRAGYAGLPPLREGCFRPWDSKEGPGQLMFSKFWLTINPEIRIWNCVDALQFVQAGRVINPSRISPLVVNAKRFSPDGFKLRLYVEKIHAVCVTAVAVTDSYLYSVPATGLPQRQLRGIVHSQEWDRLVAFFCMVFHQPELGAQLYKDSLAFTTKAGQIQIAPKGSSLYRPSAKTKKRDPLHSASRTDPFLLDVTDIVPVYDARNTDFSLQRDIDSKGNLSVFHGEIPRQSFVEVAYTASVYRSGKDGRWNFSANLLWAIVMGTPKNQNAI